MRPPHPVALFVLSGLATVALFALMLLVFGMWPEFPPKGAMAIGLMLVVLIVGYLPTFYAHETWSVWHSVGLLYGTLVTNMAIFFLAFRDATPLDFYGKLVLDGIAVILLVWLAATVSRRAQQL
jgi:hypothetical protein